MGRLSPAPSVSRIGSFRFRHPSAVGYCRLLRLLMTTAAAAGLVCKADAASARDSWLIKVPDSVGPSGAGRPPAADHVVDDAARNMSTDKEGVATARLLSRSASKAEPDHHFPRRRPVATAGGSRKSRDPRSAIAPVTHLQHAGPGSSGVNGAGGGGKLMTEDVVRFPVTFRTSGAFLITKLKLYATFGIYFQVKTTQADGLVMFSGHFDASRGTDFVAVELVEGHLRYVFDVGSGVRVIQDRLGRPVNDNRWHQVSIVRESLGQHLLRVDDSYAVDVLPDSRSVHYDLPSDGSLYIGGLPLETESPSLTGTQPVGSGLQGHSKGVAGGQSGASNVLGASPATKQPVMSAVQLPKQIRSRGVGFQGCLGSIDLNGDRWRLVDRRDEIPAEFRDEIVEGCDGPSTECTATSCANGGVCIQRWNSYDCDCDPTSYTGPTCTEDSIAYIFGQLGGLVTFSYAESARPDTRHDRLTLGFSTVQTDAVIAVIASATSKDYIEVQLVDGAIYVVYNLGLLSHPVGELEHKVNDGKYHVLRFQRHGQNASLQLDDRPPHVKHPSGRQLTTFNHQGWVTVGGKRDPNGRRVRTFHGLIAGFVWNGLWILELAAYGDKRVNIDGDVELDINTFRPRDVSTTSNPTVRYRMSLPGLQSPATDTVTMSVPASGVNCVTDQCRTEQSIARDGGVTNDVNAYRPDAVTASIDSPQRDRNNNEPCHVDDQQCRDRRRLHQPTQQPSSSQADKSLPSRHGNSSSTGGGVIVTNDRGVIIPSSTSLIDGRRELLPPSETAPDVNGNSSKTSTGDRDRRLSSYDASSVTTTTTTAVQKPNPSTSNKVAGSALQASSTSPLSTAPVNPSPVRGGGSSTPSVSAASAAERSSASTGTGSPVLFAAAAGAVGLTVAIAVVSFCVCRYRSREQGTYNLDAATTINGYAYEPCITSTTVGIPSNSNASADPLGSVIATAATSGSSSPHLPPPPASNAANGGGRRRTKSVGNGSSCSAGTSGSSKANSGGSLGRKAAGASAARTKTKKVVREWYV